MKKSLLFILTIVLLFSCKDEKKENNITTEKKTIEIPAPIKTLMDAAKKDSNNLELNLQIVTSLDSLGLYKDALINLDKFIKKDSFNNTLWLKRGQICKEAQDTVAAIKAFTYAARIYPTPQTLMELANLYAETRNPLTISICEQLMKMNPSKEYDAQAYFFVGVYYSKTGDKINALNCFNKSISQDFHFSDAYIEKGYLLYNDKRYQDALVVFVQLSKVNQMLSDGYYWQAKCNEALNKKEAAIALYEKALLLDPNLTEAKDAIEKLKK